MVAFLVTLLVTALSLLILSRLNIGLEIKDTGTALVAALVLGLLNAFLRPILGFFFFPLTLLTFGLFALVLNAVVFYLASVLVDGFRIRSPLTALIGPILLGFLNWLILLLIPG